MDGIEALRGFAAFAIVIFHVIHLTQAAVPQSLEFMKWFFGYGVPLFFVVSAFSLAYGYAGKLETRGQVAEFYVRRLFRIAPLYYLAVGAQLCVIAYVGGQVPGLGDMLLILTFLFNLKPDLVDGVAPASWSVGVEMLFYLVFPLILAAARTLPRAVLATAVMSAAAVGYVIVTNKLKLNPSFVVHGLLFNLPYFGFGLIAYQCLGRAPARASSLLIVASLAVLVALWALAPVLTVPAASGVVNVLYMLSWGAPFAILCVGMAKRPPRLLSNPVTGFLGRISFGVYLGHPQVIFLLSRLHVYQWIYGLPGGSGVTFLLAVLATAVVTVGAAWLLFVLVETPGMSLGKRLAARLGARRASEAAATT